MSNLPEPNSKTEHYLNYLAEGGSLDTLPTPKSRTEKYLYEQCVNKKDGISELVKKNTVVIVGDSTTMDGFDITKPTEDGAINDNIAWWACAYSSGKLTLGSTCSVGGWSTKNVDTYWKVRVLDKKCRFVMMAIGLNDIFGATDGTVTSVENNLRIWYKDKCTQITQNGGIPVIVTQVPVPFAYSSVAKRTAQANHNQWRRDYAKANGYPLLDVAYYVTDPSSVNGDPYAGYTQTNSPHIGKELIRFLGEMAWKDVFSNFFMGGETKLTTSKFAGNNLFANPMLTGAGGNLNSGVGAVPDNTWGWMTGSHTTYSSVDSTDAILPIAGAPVIGKWVKVSTNIASIPTASGASKQSSATPGLLFMTSGSAISAGDKISCSAEVEVLTPNTLTGFNIVLSLNGTNGKQTYISSCQSGFTPAVGATDNVKNQILTPTKFLLPNIPIIVPEGYVAGNIWLTINPIFSGKTGGTGQAEWQVRRVKFWKDNF